MRFVREEPVLRRIAVVGALMMTANGVAAVGLPLYLIDELDVGSATYGLLMSAVAAGAAAVLLTGLSHLAVVTAPAIRRAA
ncbi:hypothetical protein MF672_002755 [Actinomadura sp. ATCC 31491]|uniref:MFS transporter n=1 Tax=Actinomadura luzonensis TaxID=2805427 RepID=A0ABT0FKA4_9ACTN|nr:hypothetical protein [Actinomadura luzonensis]MCK2212722.1 hypothetical protein [Actinomadura luzonensis]